MDGLQYIIDNAHQTGAIADQHIAIGGVSIHWMARHSQNRAPLLERLPCGDKCTGFRRRLHNHNRLAEAGNEVISFGKNERWGEIQVNVW